jgi:TPR repeat protein
MAVTTIARAGRVLLGFGLFALAGLANAESARVPAAEKAYAEGDFREAARLWEKACSAGNVGGCYELAIVHRDGEGTPVDMPKYFELLETACAGDEPRACYNLGKEELTDDEDGIAPASEEQLARGMAFYERACDLGFAQACTNFALHAGSSDAARQDPEALIARFDRACTLGDGSACFALSALFDRHEATPLRDDPVRANEALQRGCNLLDRKSCSNLGFHYEYGFGVEPDSLKAAVFYELGCDDDAGLNCIHLSSGHFAGPPYTGDDVHPAWATAASVYQRSCDADFAAACFGLARVIARSGRGLQNAERMRALLEKALALDPSHAKATELLRRVGTKELPTEPLLPD